MQSIEKKYIELLSPRLENFAQKNNNTYNFKCFYCGDSKKSKTKVRGYLYLIGTTFNYRCHNCGKSISFKTFLKDLDPLLYEKFVYEKFKGNDRETLKLIPITKKKIIKRSDQTLNLSLVSELNIEHPARRYLEDRKIPEEKFNQLYYTDTFKQWTNTKKPTFKSLSYDEPRIIIPLIFNGTMFGFQGRSLTKKSKYKYITIILDNTPPKVYGLDQIDWNKNVYILEGPFDSMFIPNSIAMAGADVNMNDLEFTNKKEIDFIYIYDNEKRKKEIVQRMEKVIDQGHSIVIWPDDLKEKDINDMVLNQIPVLDVIKNNTFRGLQAKVKFNGWKKV